MRGGRSRWMLLALALALVLILGARVARAQTTEVDVEVRVAAQRLADGRTEFALQERAPDGSWDDRRLPSGRFFPANTRVGRWLGSSPLTVEAQADGMQTASGGTGVTVRVAAQLRADGRMEFALQEREPDGSWGDRRLPARRYFPANPDIGRWLSSSPLTVRVPAPTASAVPSATATASPTPAPPTSCVLADTIDGVVNATFQVQTTTGSGTAFYIGNGEWITNHHVVETTDQVSLVNGETRLAATVAGSLPDYDLALLRGQPPVSVGALDFVSTRPAVASRLSVVGFPAYIYVIPSTTSGIVSRHAPFDLVGYLSGSGGVVVQTDAEINPGNSGGPIVDDCGSVAGVATFKFFTAADGRDLDGIGFGIAAETVTAQLANLRSAGHYARSAPSTVTPASAVLEITTVCNREYLGTYDECRTAGARGLHNGPAVPYVRGLLDSDNVWYSIDGGEARDHLSLREFGRGQHSLSVNALRATGWTGWSQPYTFTITDAAPLEIRAICNGDWADYDASDECFDAGSRGILAESVPVIWTLGVSDWDNLQYSIDGGPPVLYSDLDLRSLSQGFHTIRVSEQQAAGWTGWSEPYAFTITGAAPIEITAVCNWRADQSSDECHTAGAGGILAERSPSIWRRGTFNHENTRYSIDGGPGVAWDDFTLRDLAQGRHSLRLSEQQRAGWTGWSEPYWFSIIGAAPLEVVAFCDVPASGDYTWEECDAAPVTRRGRHSLWPRGMVDRDNVRFSIDGGAGVEWEDLSLVALRDGRHNIRIAEQQPAGWTGWSPPYWFTIRE